MTKKEEKKLVEQIVTLIGDDIKDSDYILIHDLLDWKMINEKAKDELQEQVKNGEQMNWQTLTSIAMASKQIQSIIQRLGITPEKRGRKKKGEKEQKKEFDLESFLNH